MYQDDYFNPADQNDYDEIDVEKMFEREKKKDRGYNVVYRRAHRKDGTPYRKRIEIYSSSGCGNCIRDAETGEYFTNKVGSMDEDLFFKVILATGECHSANGSSTLFFVSPQHYASHMSCDVDPVIAYNWEKKRDARLAEVNKNRRPTYNSIEVK